MCRVAFKHLQLNVDLTQKRPMYFVQWQTQVMYCPEIPVAVIAGWRYELDADGPLFTQAQIGLDPSLEGVDFVALPLPRWRIQEPVIDN